MAHLQTFAVPELLGVIVVLALVGLALYTLIGRLRRWFMPWHVSSGADGGVSFHFGNAEANIAHDRI